MPPYCWGLRLPMAETHLFTWCCQKDDTFCHEAHRAVFSDVFYNFTILLRVVACYFMIELFFFNVVRNACQKSLILIAVCERLFTPWFERALLGIISGPVACVARHLLLWEFSLTSALRLIDSTTNFIEKIMDSRVHIMEAIMGFVVFLAEDAARWIARVMAVTSICLQGEYGPCMPGYEILPVTGPGRFGYFTVMHSDSWMSWMRVLIMWSMLIGFGIQNSSTFQ